MVVPRELAAPTARFWASAAVVVIKFLRARLDAHFPDRMLPYAFFWFNLRRF
jgi:hypothetical protein